MARATAAIGALSACACCKTGSLSLAVCSAQAAAGQTAPGQAANEPPNNLTNSRRFTGSPSLKRLLGTIETRRSYVAGAIAKFVAKFVAKFATATSPSVR